MNFREIVRQVTDLHAATVQRWHQQPLDNPYDQILGVVCQQHQFNFLLWHEEDIARSPHEPDCRIAEVKRAIDGYNQQRNDWIERIDEFLLRQLQSEGVSATADAPLNTETPGSVIDRLSIMSLRIYHMQEQLQRTDADDDLLAAVQVKLHRCCEQRTDLSTALDQLLADIFAGRKKLKLYRQMKMYNDPKLNPYLYKSEES